MSVPSVARTYDHMSGGGHNFAVDRAVGERIEEVVPGLRTAALGAGFGGMRRVAAR
ncbi:SAM-dependent methyltransferase, partial [Saccharothrix sp. MB29]|nr:SAM-dependent methyltransferase [Saccharothrix sp. MB29]